MGYSLEICYNCNYIDATSNLELNDDKGYSHKICNLKCEKMKIDEKYERLYKLFPNKRYISCKPIMSPDTETAQNYLKKFFLKRNFKNPNNMTIWNEFWKGIDYLVLNENKENTKKFKEYLNFVNDLLY